MIEALLVMMNNYFHDLAVAFLFASTLLGHLALREWPVAPPRRMLETLNKVAIWSLVWIIVGGAVRAWFYADYEWAPRAGTAQVPALAVKHVLLFGVTAWGLWGLHALNRRVRESAAGEPTS